MAHRESLVRRYGDVPLALRAYRCPICGFWHLGRGVRVVPTKIKEERHVQGL